MFRAARCSSSEGQILLPQPLVSSPSVNSRTVCRWRADTRGCGDTICPLEDEQRGARNMAEDRSVTYILLKNKGIVH